MSTIQFTRRWWKRGVANWQTFLQPLAGLPLVYLEIGVFEGGSACWMLDNVLTAAESRYIGIDPWNYRKKFDGHEVERRARQNLQQFASKVEIIRDGSQTALRQPRWKDESIDIGYIDGDHSAHAVLADSILLWPLVKPNGIVIWDDYRLPRRKPVRDVSLAVNAFLSCIDGQYELLFKNYQLGIRKRAIASKA